ncbi:GumC domain-containing protein [Stieleria varia]|uniref:hypothetical protein n=1 Tax=Stieleria varia TaxID=2528005 RepID=UPI0011B4682C|nr:hypothetical protein [Stieleria varia]
MSAPKTFLSSLLSIVAWGVLGGVVGLGGGYFAFVKKKPRFHASTTIQVSRPGGSSDVTRPTDDSVAAGSSQQQASTEAAATVVGLEGSAEGAGEEGVGDDRLLFLSQGVVDLAVSAGELSKLSEIREAQQVSQKTSASLAAVLSQSGRVRIDAPVANSMGNVYVVHCFADTPSSSQQMANAIAVGFQKFVTTEGTQTDWQQSIDVMRELLQYPSERLVDLREQLAELDVPTDASLVDGEVMSVAAEQLRQLRPRVESLVSEQGDMRSKSRGVESLINQGASAEIVLTALGQVSHRRDARDPQQGTRDAELAKAKKAYQEKVAERQKVADEVRRNLVPLQVEKDRLLKQFGAQHPQVKAVDLRMSDVRMKLDLLPPLGPEPGVAEPAAASPFRQSDPGEGESKGPDQDVSVVLSALRSEQRQVDDELKAVRLAAEQAAATVAVQQRVLEEAQRIRKEIATEEALRDQILARLESIPVVAPVAETRVEILQDAMPGEQSDPALSPHLAIGGAMGAVSGLILGCLLVVTSVARAEPGDSE